MSNCPIHGESDPFWDLEHCPWCERVTYVAAFLAWLKTRNISSHTVAMAVIGMSGLIVSDQQVRDFLIKTLAHHPDVATAVIGMAGIIFKYSQPSKEQK